MTLLPVAQAQARLIALAPALAEENVPLLDALGRWSARDVLALRTQPAADLSAMDGYALRFAELPGPFTVIGESAAGRGLDRAIAPGEAARIFTGAPMPEGADTVLIQEEAARDGAMLRLAGEGPPRTGAHVRRAGGDFATGTTLLRAGDPITPARIALAAVGGHGALPVRRRPRVALLSTGNELVPAGEPVAGVRLPSSNAPMLAAMLRAQGVAIVEDHGIVRDDLAAIVAAIGCAKGADIIVTTGGASVGDHDLVRPALLQAGADIDFWKVALKPGKPLMAGRLGDAVVLGLPGNPVSAFVTAWLFLLPLIAGATGARDPLPARLLARLDGTLPPTGSRMEFVRAVRRDGMVTPLPGQDSAGLFSLAQAAVLIPRQPDSRQAGPGEMVEIMALT